MRTRLVTLTGGLAILAIGSFILGATTSDFGTAKPTQPTYSPVAQQSSTTRDSTAPVELDLVPTAVSSAKGVETHSTMLSLKNNTSAPIRYAVAFELADDRGNLIQSKPAQIAEISGDHSIDGLDLKSTLPDGYYVMRASVAWKALQGSANGAGTSAELLLRTSADRDRLDRSKLITWIGHRDRRDRAS